VGAVHSIITGYQRIIAQTSALPPQKTWPTPPPSKMGQRVK